MNEITIAAILALALAPATALACEVDDYCDCELAVPPAEMVDGGEEAEAPEAQPDEFVPLVSAEDFKWMGVVEYGGRLESYYSSKVAYHYRTPEWEVDDEGFYRTPEGYYVVAASDMDEGTVFDGSRGLCQVLDSGCGDGVTDYYVAW